MPYGPAAGSGCAAGPAGRGWRLRAFGVIAFLGLGLAPVAACAHAPCPPELTVQEAPRVDTALRRMIEEEPDSVVGVLVMLSAPGNGTRRAELEAAGLSIGTIAGEIVTGRLRACDAVRVARLESVRYVELAREVPRAPVPDLPNP